MMARLLPFSHPFALRLAILLLLGLPNLAAAQTSVNYCEPRPDVKEDLKQVSNMSEQDLPFRVIRERQLARLQDLLKKYPDDFQVRRRYQDVRRSGYYTSWEPLLADYRQQMEKNPADAAATYLYSRLLVGRTTKEAILLSNKLPDEFPWGHLQLAEIYSYPLFRDIPRMTEQLKQFMAKCPTSLAGLRLVSRSGDKTLMLGTQQSLRTRLEAATTKEDLYYWDSLWSLEFKLKPVTEHDQVRKQIVDDLKRIRAAQPSSEQFEALQSGYKQLGDKPNQRWAEDELIRLMPKSPSARRIAQSRFYDDHPSPKAGDTPAQRQAYQEAVLKQTAEWLKTWSNDEFVWSTRLRTLAALDTSTKTDVETAYREFAKIHEQSGSYSVPPVEVSVARFYLKHGFNLEAVPVLLQKGVAEIEQIETSNPASDLYPRPTDSDESNLKYVKLEAWPMVAEAYARLKQPDKARAVLDQIAELTKRKTAGKESDSGYTYGRGIYWRAVGKVAEIEQRKLDALMAYQTVLAVRGKPNTPPGEKDEMSESMQRLWKELGGTDEGSRAYLARSEAPKGKVDSEEPSSWDPKNTALAEFELTDLQGRKWSTNDLKGKVAFINLWATWCSPCRAELPYVQKLREQLKDRKDVQVVTLNIDEDVGKVEPFMKENKYTFPVLLGQAYADTNGVNSIPRNWVISADGKVLYEGRGFGDDGDGWLKEALQMIEKAKGTP